MKWIEELGSMERLDPETQYAMDERQAIQDVDGGHQDNGQVEVKMDSAILGDAVDVILEPDQAQVDGVQYSNAELVDLIGRGIAAADLRVVHRVKMEFGGEVMQLTQLN